MAPVVQPHAASKTPRILTRDGGLHVDHVALAVPDMPRALERVARDTGAEPFSTSPEPGQWYWSGALALGHHTFLEILGPNPHHRGLHPLKELIASYAGPRVLFWYVATDDLESFAAHACRHGAPLERREAVDSEGADGRTAYERAVLGPGFLSQRPCVIAWHARPERPGIDESCRLLALRLCHPDAARLNALFQHLGIAQRVERGPSRIGVVLSTPRGDVVYENPGESFVGIRSLWRMAWLSLRSLRRR